MHVGIWHSQRQRVTRAQEKGRLQGLLPALRQDVSGQCAHDIRVCVPNMNAFICMRVCAQYEYVRMPYTRIHAFCRKPRMGIYQGLAVGTEARLEEAGEGGVAVGHVGLALGYGAEHVAQR